MEHGDYENVHIFAKEKWRLSYAKYVKAISENMKIIMLSCSLPRNKSLLCQNKILFWWCKATRFDFRLARCVYRYTPTRQRRKRTYYKSFSSNTHTLCYYENSKVCPASFTTCIGRSIHTFVFILTTYVRITRCERG